MVTVRIPSALKGLDIYNEDTSYWQKVLRLNDEEFREYAGNLYNIVRARWPERSQLNRFNEGDIKLVSAHLRSMVDRMSLRWLTTPGELDEMLIVNVAFAFFLNDLDKYKEVVSETAQSIDSQNFPDQESTPIVNQEPGDPTTNVLATDTA